MGVFGQNKVDQTLCNKSDLHYTRRAQPSEQHIKPSLLLSSTPSANFPLIKCFLLFALLYWLFYLFFPLRLEHVVGWASAANAEIIAFAHPTNFPPTSTTSNKPNCRNEMLLIHEQRDWRKGKDGGRSKKKCGCQKKPKQRVWGGTLNLGKPSHCEKTTATESLRQEYSEL